MRRTFIYIFGILFLHTAYGQQEETHQATTVRDTLQSVAVIDTLSQEQNLTALEKGRDFVIGGIEVKGAKHYNAQTIIVASGLSILGLQAGRRLFMGRSPAGLVAKMDEYYRIMA